MAEERKLATIMSVDVAGYTRAAETDESAAAQTVAKLQHCIQEIIPSLGGRVFNTAGDGVMIEFPVATAGAQAALALLKRCRDAEDFPRIRIGLHMGEVIVTPHGDLLGHGVNVAARLQARAQPGTAIVSQAVQSQVRHAADIPFVPLGRMQLDKMSERIEAYCLAPNGGARSARFYLRRAAPPLVVLAILATLLATGVLGIQVVTRGQTVPQPSLAVMAFAPVSGGASEQRFSEEFSSAVHEMLTSPNIRLVSTSTSFALRGEGRSMRAIRAQLHADYVLDGTIARRGEHVDVTAELISTATGEQIWRERFQSEASRLQWVQSQINVSTRAALLIIADARARGRDVDPAALKFFLSAWAHNPEGEDIYASHPGAIDSYRRAIEIQPDFAQAWSDLSRVYAAYRYRGPTQEVRTESQAEGRRAVRRALEVSPRDPYALAMRAQFSDHIGDKSGYQRWLDRAMRAGRLQPTSLSIESYELARFGRARDALPIAMRAQALDAFALYVYDSPDPTELLETPAAFEDRIRPLGVSAPDPPANWRQIHMGWLATGDRARAQRALESFEAMVDEIALNRTQMSPRYAAKARRWLEENRALHAALYGGERARAAYLQTLIARADTSAEGFRHDRTAEEFYTFVLPGIALLGGADAAFAAWEQRLAPLPQPDARWVADQPLEHETYYFNESLFKPLFRPLRADPRLWRMIARGEFPEWWLDDERWPPDFCSAPDLGYDCAAAARAAFEARA